MLGREGQWPWWWSVGNNRTHSPAGSASVVLKRLGQIWGVLAGCILEVCDTFRHIGNEMERQDEKGLRDEMEQADEQQREVRVGKVGRSLLFCNRLLMADGNA